jgi:hypothetical protein
MVDDLGNHQLFGGRLNFRMDAGGVLSIFFLRSIDMIAVGRIIYKFSLGLFIVNHLLFVCPISTLVPLAFDGL